MADFTSALYLGFRHASSSLRPWRRLTTGVPAVLGVPAEAIRLAQQLADLLGSAQATLAPSTLHLFWDLLPLLAGTDGSIHIDAGAYPIGRWGAERALAGGTPVWSFPHHDALALFEQLRLTTTGRRKPVVLVDGYCPGCGPPPLAEYSALAQRFGGHLVIDDTQGVGVLGGGQVRLLRLASAAGDRYASLASGARTS